MSHLVTCRCTCAHVGMTPAPTHKSTTHKFAQACRPDFNFETAYKSAGAVAGLCNWVSAMVASIADDGDIPEGHGLLNRAKTMMTAENLFFSFKANHLKEVINLGKMPKANIDACRKTLEEWSKLKTMPNVSKATAAIMLFIKNIVIYYDIVFDIEPKLTPAAVAAAHSRDAMAADRIAAWWLVRRSIRQGNASHLADPDRQSKIPRVHAEAEPKLDAAIPNHKAKLFKAWILQLSAAPKGCAVAETLCNSLDAFRRFVVDRDLFFEVVLHDKDSGTAALLLKLGAKIDSDFKEALMPHWESLLRNSEGNNLALLLLETDTGLREQCCQKIFIDESGSLTELWRSLLLSPQQADFVRDVMVLLPALHEKTCQPATLTLALSLLLGGEEVIGIDS